MFYVTYLRRELRRRMRQAIFIAAGLAIGVGLVITVTAASAGVRTAQADVLRSLYGVGTDVTVTKSPPPFNPAKGGSGGTRISLGPNGGQVCQNGKCSSGAQTIDNLVSTAYGPMGYQSVEAAARQRDVTAAAGGLSLTDRSISIPANFASGGGTPKSNSFTVDGVDLAHQSLGPLSDGSISSGRSLRSSDASSNVAVVDSGYATANGLKAGSTITIAKAGFTVAGIVSQPQGSNAPDVYIPLARAQALGTTGGSSLAGQVNTIYVSAASAADVSAVQNELHKAVPGATVTTSSSLASQVSGSLASTARLANDLGRWLSVLVLIAAFAVASLLTMAAVSRRVREFGTLKALGWRTRRVMAQVLGESVTTGVIGGALGVALGVALGFGGAALIGAIAPKLYATVQTATGQHIMTMGPNGPQASSPTVPHTVAVPMSAQVTVGAIVAAVLLAVAGGLLAGSFGSWRIGKLRPASALARVE